MTDYFDFNDTFGTITINNSEQIFLWLQNWYLSEEMNKKSINFNSVMVHNFYIIFDQDIRDSISICELYYKTIRHGHDVYL